MIEDPIVNEVRKHRQAHAERYGNNLKKIAEALREKQEQSGQEVINFGPKMLPMKQLG